MFQQGVGFFSIAFSRRWWQGLELVRAGLATRRMTGLIRSQSSAVSQQIGTPWFCPSSLCYRAQLWPRWSGNCASGFLQHPPTHPPHNLMVDSPPHTGSLRERSGSVQLRHEPKEDTQMWSVESLSNCHPGKERVPHCWCNEFAATAAGTSLPPGPCVGPQMGKPPETLQGTW